ncbi:MAG: YbaN family protein [Acidimicrobiia bacterium]|nr:YbaN family protein [Acidimicrobiia bacterium]
MTAPGQPTGGSDVRIPGRPTAADGPGLARSRLVRAVWIAAGLVLVGIGAVGIVVPGLPSTIFFILAAAAFSRSSARLERWLLNLPVVGKLVGDYRAGLGMRRRAKIAAVSMIVIAVGISTGLAIKSWTPRAIVLGAGAVGVAYVGWRVPTREVLDRAVAEGAG